MKNLNLNNGLHVLYVCVCGGGWDTTVFPSEHPKHRNVPKGFAACPSPLVPVCGWPSIRYRGSIFHTLQAGPWSQGVHVIRKGMG